MSTTRTHTREVIIIKRLTLKQMRFCQYYILTLANGSLSARLANYKGYSKQQSYRLRNTLSVRIFSAWYFNGGMNGRSTKDLKHTLHFYGYTVSNAQLAEALDDRPTLNISFDKFKDPQLAKEIYNFKS